METTAKRNRLPSARVTDASNDGELQLSSHRRARDAQHCDNVAQSHVTTTKPPKRKHPDASTSARTSNFAVAETSESLADQVPQSAPNQDEGEYKNIFTFQTTTNLSSIGASGSKRVRPATPSETSGEEDSKTKTITKNRSLDVDAFFSAAEKGHDKKPRRKCKLCLWVLDVFLSSKSHYLFLGARIQTRMGL